MEAADQPALAPTVTSLPLRFSAADGLPLSSLRSRGRWREATVGASGGGTIRPEASRFR